MNMAAQDEHKELRNAAIGYSHRGWPVMPVSRPLPGQPCDCDRATRDRTPEAHQAPAGLHVGCSVCGICNEPGKHPEFCEYIVGRLLGPNGSASYRSAKQGFLPTVQVSERRWVVPTATLLRLLGLEAVTGHE